MKKNSSKAKTYSVIIISDATSTSRTFSVSARLVRRALVATFAFFLLFGFILFHYLTINLDKQKMHRVMNEKRENDKKLTEYSSAFKDVTQKLDEMQRLSEKLMVITGLTSPDALKGVGLGGPVTEEEVAGEQMQLPDNVRAIPGKNQQKLTPQQLTENAKNLEKTFKQVISYVNDQNLRYAATPSIAPTRGYFSSTFSYRTNPFTQTREFHSGVDISTQLGNKVIAPADGVILVAETQGGFGKTIIIDHGFGFISRYAHLAEYKVRVGQKVKRRDIIGLAGSTGRSTAPHLHYEIQYFGKAVNPFYFILDLDRE